MRCFIEAGLLCKVFVCAGVFFAKVFLGLPHCARRTIIYTGHVCWQCCL